MADLVTRDRNHPSVIYWSFCNEAGCGSGGTQPSLDFKITADTYDGSRAVTANTIGGGQAGGNMTQILDLQVCFMDTVECTSCANTGLLAAPRSRRGFRTSPFLTC
jgi:beta-galactosidase/beta-glucuronidase